MLEGDRDDGEKLEDLTAAFRGEFRSSLLVASCKGLADMLVAAGMPFAIKHGRGASEADAHARPSAPPNRVSPSRPRSPSPERDPDLADDLSTDHCSTASSSEDDDAISLEPPIAPRRSARVRARAAAQPASDVLSIVVCNGFPVVT